MPRLHRPCFANRYSIRANLSISGCFHCGLPIPSGSDWSFEHDGRRLGYCCAGCEAVSRTILEGGLQDFYLQRAESDPALATAQQAVAIAALEAWDHPQAQEGLVTRERAPDGSERAEAALLVRGITCAACVWLLEQHVARLPGVLAFSLNYATHRARLVWDPARLTLSAVLRAVAAIGYGAEPYDARRAEAARRGERRTMLWRLAVAGLGMMQVMMYAYPAYIAGPEDITPDIVALMRIASLVLTVPVLAFSAAPFFRGALRDLRLRRVGMDVPVALGIGIAFAASVHATLTGRGEVYFDSVTMFVFLLLGARWLELLVRARAGRHLEDLSLARAGFAERLLDHPRSMRTERVPATGLAPGDCLLVASGATFPADGVLVSAEAQCDEALLTGESRPVSHRAGGLLVAGSINLGQPVVMRVQACGAATRLAGIARLAERALADKPPLAELADRYAGRFLASILLLAGLAALAWQFVDPARSLPVAISVLIVTCPCALSLAAPLALTAAMAQLSRQGVLVTRSHAIESLARADGVVFDKTGTLTHGRLALLAVTPGDAMDGAALLSLAAALEGASLHPVARALREVLGTRGIAAADADGLQEFPGEGVQGTAGARRVRVGSVSFVQALHGVAPPAGLAAAMLASRPGASSLVALGDEAGWLGWLEFGDTLREDAAATVAALHALDVDVVLLSGDREAAARPVALGLGITDVRAGLSPEDKLAALRALQGGEGGRGAGGRRTIAAVGDGINDAPLLAAADVSVAMGSGSALAQNSADIVLLSDRLCDLTVAHSASRRALAVVRQNLAWALVYNLASVPAAALGMVPPWLAGVGMALSSALVAGNALRLLSPVRARADGAQACPVPLRAAG